MTPNPPDNSTSSAYDAVAEEYVRRIYGELSDKPFDRALLDELCAFVPKGELMLDLGCGPGHVAKYLHDHGARVCGVDNSPKMIEIACRLTPDLQFRFGDMRRLPLESESAAAAIAFYSIIHFREAELEVVFSEIRRVLRPGGRLLVAFHVGDNVVHLDTLWDIKVDIDFSLFEPPRVADAMIAAGLKIVKVLERDPYDVSVEVQTRRCYIVADLPDL
jgi:SAM-dependent methyltransferase